MEVWIRDARDAARRARRLRRRDVRLPGRLVARRLRSCSPSTCATNSDSSIDLARPRDGRRSRELTPHEGEDGSHSPAPWAAGRVGLLPPDRRGPRVPRRSRSTDLADGRYEWVETPECGRRGGGPLRRRSRARLARQRGRLGCPEAPRPRVRRDAPRAPASRRGAGPHLTGRRPLDRTLPTTAATRAAVILVGAAAPPRGSASSRPATGQARARSPRAWIGGLRERRARRRSSSITYPTCDDREIPAWLYRPCRGRGRCPGRALHPRRPGGAGAPAGTSPLYQYLVSRGIAVLATNIRGSTGYGKTYQTARTPRLGRRRPEATGSTPSSGCRRRTGSIADRIGVYGGSYGGFATLTCVTRLPDYWAAAVDIVGPCNLVTFAKAVPPTWRRFMEQVGRQSGRPRPTSCMERSPITYVENVRDAAARHPGRQRIRAS